MLLVVGIDVVAILIIKSSGSDLSASHAGPPPTPTPSPGEAIPEAEWTRTLRDLEKAANSDAKQVVVPFDSQNGPLRMDPSTGEYNQIVLRFTGSQLRTEEATATRISRNVDSVESIALKAPDVKYANESAVGSLPFGARKLTVTVAGGDTSDLLTDAPALAKITDTLSRADTIPSLFRIQDTADRGLYIVTGIPAFGGKYRFGMGWASESVTAKTGLSGGVGSLLPKEPR